MSLAVPAPTRACSTCAALHVCPVVAPVMGSMLSAIRSPTQFTVWYFAMNTALSPATGLSVLAAAPDPEPVRISIDCSVLERLSANVDGSPALK